MDALIIINIVICILGVIDILSMLKNHLFIKKPKSNTLYKVSYDGVSRHLSIIGLVYVSIDSLYYWISTVNREFNMYYNVVVPLFMISYFVFKRVLKAKITSDGIILSRGIFIPYDDIIRFEINITPGEKKYSVKIICSKNHIESLIINKDFLETFLNIAQEKTSAHISKLYEQFDIQI